ncbi:MAG: DNA mismatch repair protein [Oscillospiraceae bacterium]|nr:DNA mismatch repair protein [Oscillospiraceae bacterium]
MKQDKYFSILFPYYESTEYKQLSAVSCHDLGIDSLCDRLTVDAKERRMISDVLSNMTSDPRVAQYRQKVFADILKLPKLRTELMELFDKMEFIRNFGIMHKTSDERLGVWHLYHRLEELNDYIKCVEAMKKCLSDAKIESEGLIGFRNHIDMLYNEACFKEMKEDVAELKAKTSGIQSVTLGINLNERFEAVSMGLVSVNDKVFKKSGIVSNFAEAISSKNGVHKGTDWNGDFHYHQVENVQGSGFAGFVEKMAGYSYMQNVPFADSRVRSTIVNVPEGDGINNSTFYLEKVLNRMLESLVKKLRDTLTKYANIAVMNISQLIPEFVYYIRFAEFVEKNMEKGFPFCEAQVIDDADTSMDAKWLYNLKLAMNVESKDDIVYNDLVFDKEHTIYILTGANRGGKTTVTQAVGLMFVLAQGGIFVPASSFGYRPVDCIYTHFPADEDKTMDLGRLGEECVRFKEIYSECTSDSLLLLNETFSTTSFEEGFYIARDSVRALVSKRVRTIYNTHMHKLAAEAQEFDGGAGVSSLIMKSDNGKRSFKVEVASPEGLSYARDIAEKYGVTYEMLTGGN